MPRKSDLHRDGQIIKEPFELWTATWLFGVFFLSDFINAVYVIFTSQGLAVLASITSAALTGLAYVGVHKFLRQPWYIVPIVLGALVGTFVSINIFR
jgi:hypothetical protein